MFRERSSVQIIILSIQVSIYNQGAGLRLVWSLMIKNYPNYTVTN